MRNLPEGLEGDPLRRASGPVRGFHYQFWRTVEAWMELAADEILFVEGAEDFDRVGVGDATAVQIKDDRASGPLTLSSPKALVALGNFWTLLNANRGRPIRFKFITTAAVGVEREGFAGRRGIDVWNLCGRSPLESASNDVAAIRDFIVKRKSLEPGLVTFLERGELDRIHQEIVQPVEWLYDQPNVDDFREILVGRLREIGDPQGLTVRDAQRLAHDLYMRVVAEAIRRDPRPLGYVDFMEMLEHASHIQIPRRLLQRQAVDASVIDELMTRGSRAADQQLPELTEADDAFAPPVLRKVWRRGHLQDKVRAGLATGLVFVDGGTGMGKTIAVRQAVEGANPVLWAALRDRTAAEIVEIAQNLIQRVASRAGQPLVVLDDLNPTGDPRSLEEHLGRLSAAVRARRGALAVISYNAAGPRLASVLGLSASSQVTASAFEEDEIAQWMIDEGCPEGRARLLAGIVWLHTRGHPQLVAARVAGLKAAAFLDATSQDVLEQPREIDDARAEAFAVIRSVLPEPARSLLYRMSLAIPPLKRSHVLRIGQAEPPVPRVGEMFEILVGPWLEQPLPDRYRVSALASTAGRDLLPPDEAKRIHAQIASALLAERSVTATEYSGAIAHALSGQAEAHLAVAVRVFLVAPVQLKRRLADGLRWVASIGIQSSSQLRLDNKAVRQVFRLFQWEVAGLAATKYLEPLSAVMEEEFAAVSGEPGDELLQILYLFKQLLEINHPLPPEHIVRHTLEVWRRTEQANSQGLSIGRSVTPMYPEAQRPVFSDLFAAALISRMSVTADLDALISALESLSPSDRQRLLDGFQTDDGELRLLFSSPGIALSRGAAPAALEGYARVLERAMSAGRRWQHRPWMRASGRALATVFDELLDRPQEAWRILTTTIQEVESSNGLEDQLATIAFNRKDYAAALEIWQRILPGWEADRLFHDMQPAFSTRYAAISAAHLGQWDLSANLFGRAIERSGGMGTRPWRVGLLGDRGYALWQSGDRRRAVGVLREAVEALAGMPNRPESFAEYAVQKLVGHTLAWMTHAEGHAEPIPGMCSNLNPSEMIKELPPSPASHMWFLLYDLARQAGDDSIRAEALGKFRSAPFAALRAIAARDELARMLRAGVVAGIARLAGVAAFEMAKSTARKDVPSPQPDPPGLTGQVTEGLVARYVRPALWAGIMSAKVSGRDIRELVRAWRSEIGHAEDAVLQELTECDRHAEMQVGELMGILDDRDAPGGQRALAAALLVGRDDTSPRDALYAQAMLIGASANFDLLRDTATEVFAELTRRDWLRFCDNAAVLHSPRLYADAIRRACQEAGSDWQSAARIVLAALPATSLTIPSSLRSRLDALSVGG